MKYTVNKLLPCSEKKLSNSTDYQMDLKENKKKERKKERKTIELKSLNNSLSVQTKVLRNRYGKKVNLHKRTFFAEGIRR